ncbi:MAG TPA: hypothetical protein VJ276_26195 [Thermoanaerobaculia bacterium]|nr:hypothetical protein [Thermoanaerobaculia bacterium]
MKFSRCFFSTITRASVAGNHKRSSKLVAMAAPGHPQPRYHRQAMDEELKKLIEGSAAETRRHFEAVAERLESKVDESVAETRRHFEIVAERLESKIATVAEAVTALHEQIIRFKATIKEELADIRSKIKFSHGELTSHPTL